MKKGEFFNLLYALVVAVLIAYRWDEFKTMRLNELGDFFAGAVGPLALIWLVFGYKQQGDELRLSTKALDLQAQELKNSVDQQTKMVIAQEESLRNYERSLEPIFKLSVADAGWDEDDFYCKLAVENLGEYCERIIFKAFYQNGRVKTQNLDPMFTGESVVRWCRGMSEWEDFNVVVSYVVRSGRRNSQSFMVIGDHDGEGGHFYIVQKNAFLSAEGSQV